MLTSNEYHMQEQQRHHEIIESCHQSGDNSLAVNQLLVTDQINYEQQQQQQHDIKEDDHHQSTSNNFKQLVVCISSIIATALTILNASLFFWINSSLNARTNLGQHTDSFIKLTPESLDFHGQSMFSGDLEVPQINSKSSRSKVENQLEQLITNTVMQFNTDGNMTFGGELHGSGQPTDHRKTLSLLSSGVIELGNTSAQLIIQPSSSSSLIRPKVTIDSSSVSVEADKLISMHKAGLDAQGLSIQTRRICNSGDEGLSVHSPTQKLTLLTPKELKIQSLNDSVSFEAGEQVSIRSLQGSVIMSSPLIDVTNIRTITPSQTGRTYLHIYKLCHCHMRAIENTITSTSTSTLSTNSSGSSISDHHKVTSQHYLLSTTSIMEAPLSLPASKSRQPSRLGLLFGVRPALNCSSFSWYCNIDTEQHNKQI